MNNNNNESEFQDYIGQFGKNYGTTSEMNDRLNIWLENKKEVDGLNAANEGTGVTFGMNSTSDMTEAEFLEMQGFGAPNKPNNSNSSDSSSNSTGGGSRRLQQDLSIDWRAQNKVHEVKNQGSCGSCWAFAAATVQESMQAIKNDAPVVRLSEQEGVDCDQRSYGCSGGWMSYYWQMSAEIGSSSNEAYKYEATDGACRNQQNKTIVSRAKENSIKKIHYSDMREQLQQGPLSIAVAAGNSCWRYYESGILSEENNCPTGLDHGVAIVGLNDTGDKPYWIIQNSWGKYWGNEGFIWIAVEEGDGTSAMNTHVEAMDVEEGYPDPDGDDEEDKDDDDQCDVDELQNYGMCSEDSECRGKRHCSKYGFCMGEDECDKKEPDNCDVDESQNPLGPS